MAVTVKIETITPKKAQDWLVMNTHNRTPRRAKILQYANDMKAGRWRLSGDTIKFGTNGEGDFILIDGQNRLHAVIYSHTPIDTVVVRGLEYVDVMPVVDTGAARTMGDVLKLKGEKDYNSLSGILVSYWRQTLRAAQDPNSYPSHQEVLETLETTPEAREAAALSRATVRRFPIRTAAFGAALLFGWDIDEPATTLFADQVSTGEGLVRKDPAYMLRQWITNARTSHRMPSPETWTAVTNKALISHLEGRSLGVLKWSRSHEFPYIQDAEIVEA